MKYFTYVSKQLFIYFIFLIITIFGSYIFLYSFFNKNYETNLLNQFFSFIKNIFNQSLKPSSIFLNNSGFESVNFLVYKYWEISMIILGISFGISLFLGISIGLYLGFKVNSLTENVVSLIIFIFAAVPTFIFAPILLSVAEINDIPILYVADSGPLFWFLSIILPILLLSIIPISYIATNIKTSVILISKKDFITQLKSNGMSNLNVFFKGYLNHLIANLITELIPIYLLMNSFLIILEKMFQIPGQSMLILLIFETKDFNVLVFFVSIQIIIFLLFSFISTTIFNYLTLNYLKNNKLIVFNLQFKFKTKFQKRRI
ncbi:ABC transporter permease subunit [Mycoplasmopsis gallinarum]